MNHHAYQSDFRNKKLAKLESQLTAFFALAMLIGLAVVSRIDYQIFFAN